MRSPFMARRRIKVAVESWGIYRHWDSESKELPRVAEFTLRVPALIGIEFGFVVSIVGAKNQKLYYCIDHPGILDADGQRRPPFDGHVYVKTNDWNFYLGDTIWEPVDDKLGEWRMWLELDGVVQAQKTFEVSRDFEPGESSRLDDCC